MPASIKHLTDKKIAFTSLLARWKDGLYYKATVNKCDKASKRCLVRFEDGSEIWANNRDVHLQLSLDQIDEDADIVCCICDDGNSEPPNEIILCDVCQQGYHQKCHNPPVDSSKIDESDDNTDHKDWFCATCSYILHQSDPSNLTGSSSSAHKSQPSSSTTSQTQQKPKQQQPPQPKPKSQPQQQPQPKSHPQQQPKSQPQQQPQQPQQQTQQKSQQQKQQAFNNNSTKNNNTTSNKQTVDHQQPTSACKVTSTSTSASKQPPSSQHAVNKPAENTNNHQHQIKPTKAAPASVVSTAPSTAPSSNQKSSSLSPSSTVVGPVKSTPNIQRQAPYYPLSSQVRVAATSSTAALASMTASSALVVGNSAGRTKQDLVNRGNRQVASLSQRSPDVATTMIPASISPGHAQATSTVTASASPSTTPVKHAVRKSGLNFVLPVRKSALPVATRSVIPPATSTMVSTMVAAPASMGAAVSPTRTNLSSAMTSPLISLTPLTASKTPSIPKDNTISAATTLGAPGHHTNPGSMVAAAAAALVAGLRMPTNPNVVLSNPTAAATLIGIPHHNTTHQLITPPQARTTTANASPTGIAGTATIGNSSSSNITLLPTSTFHNDGPH